MAEYIEREAVIAKNHGGMVYIDDIKEIPSADVAAVRKGRWETIGLASLKCSKCGYLDDMKMYHRYCPDCGCFMR